MKYALIALGVLLALAGAFSAGRFSAPLQVETKEVERVVYKDREVVKVVTVQAKAETKVVYRDRVIYRDGTITEREVERTDTKTDTKTNTDRVATRDTIAERWSESKTTLRPDWRVSVLAGASLQPPALTIAGPLVLGVEVNRRIAGGLWLGVWATTYGAGGASVAVEF